MICKKVDNYLVGGIMKLSNKSILAAALPAFFFAASGAAAAEESEPKNLSVTVGLKAWANEWQSWNTPGSPQFGAANAVALNPSVTVKYKNVFVSAGVMPKTNYDVPISTNGTTTPASRREMDVSAGYYVHPQVAVTLGYKQITQTWGTTDYIWKIPAVGVSLAAAIQNTRMFMYGNAAVGWAFVSTNPSTTATIWNLKGGTYTTSEIGVGYSVLPSFRLTLGYKYQICPTSTEVQKNTTRITMTDSTRGFVFGGSYTF